MVIVNNSLYFKNTIGDISAVDINEGELLWQLPTQTSLINEVAFSLETSDLVTDGNSLFFSNNENQFFSIDLETGRLNWKNKVLPLISNDFLKNHQLYQKKPNFRDHIFQHSFFKQAMFKENVKKFFFEYEYVEINIIYIITQ